MNVERLHKILLDLEKDFKSSNLLNLLQEVLSHLNNQISQPNQPVHQTNLVASLDKLYINLNSSDYNNFSPGWKEIISEINGENLLGLQLKKKIESIFSANTITPAKASEDIQKIATNFQTFQTSVISVITGFKNLGIAEEKLEPGDCEFGYMIPRKYVDNKLSSLNSEISVLNFILTHVTEAVSNKKIEYKVKTISSSDFLLYVIIGLQVADVLSKATERILNHYKQILEIKVLRNQLSGKGVPEEKTKEIDSYANEMMESEIKNIAKEIISEYYKGEAGRKNELENSLVISFNKLANRIDNGFNVEIRIEPLPPIQEETNISKKEQNHHDLVKSIQKSAKNIEFIETRGKSILKLPEKNVK